MVTGERQCWQVNGGRWKVYQPENFCKSATCWCLLLQLAATFESDKILATCHGCANSLISRGSDVGPTLCDGSELIQYISQERGRHQTGVGPHCKTRPERHKVLLISEVFFLAFVISDIAFLIVSTKLWKQKVVSICSIACIQHLSVKVDFHKNFLRFFYQKKKFQLPQYVPYSLPGFSQPHYEYH